MIEDNKIIAIIRGIDIAKLPPTVEALICGGIKLIEVTFNHSLPNTLQETSNAIRLLSENYKEICVGAGTVLTPEQAAAAISAGAKYVISPNTDLEVIRKTKELGALSIPGALTPSEVALAAKTGADFVKLFPVDNLGLDYAKALMGPLGHIPMLAVGGVNAENIQDFIGVGFAGVGIGGNIVNKKLIDNGCFAEIRELAKVYTEKIQAMSIYKP